MRVTTSLSFAIVTIRHLPPAASAVRPFQDSACLEQIPALLKPTSENVPFSRRWVKKGAALTAFEPDPLIARGREAHPGGHDRRPSRSRRATVTCTKVHFGVCYTIRKHPHAHGYGRARALA